jgi:hypothetical protein
VVPFHLRRLKQPVKVQFNAIEKAREEGWLIVGIQHIATSRCTILQA